MSASSSRHSSRISAFVFGAGGLGSLVFDILAQRGEVRVTGWLDSNPALRGQRILGVPVLGGMDRCDSAQGVTHAIVAIGDNRIRVSIAEQLRAQGFTLLSAISPLASIAPSATLGEHLIIGARAIVCVHARIGDHAVVSTGAIVEHDNRIGNGAFLHPAVRLAGGVTIDDHATLGIGACVTPGCRVGRAATVEPGSVVIRDVLPGASVSGVPARGTSSDTSRFVEDPFEGVPQPA